MNSRGEIARVVCGGSLSSREFAGFPENPHGSGDGSSDTR